MKYRRTLAAAGAGALVAVLIWSGHSFAVSGKPVAGAASAAGQKPNPNCVAMPSDRSTDNKTLLDPMPADLSLGLPCTENAQFSGPAGSTPQDNLQRGFDFYSWITFLALNAPDGGSPITAATPNTRAKWENIGNFRQLADVMLPHGAKPLPWGQPSPPPPECKAQFKSGMTIIHRIEEAFNQPFKSGPLIDQNGRFALFDILMNKSMYDYIVQHHLYSKAFQASTAGANETVEFPFGTTAPLAAGAVMLKVSWKVIDPIKDASQKDRFHLVTALIYAPASEDGKRKATCSGPTTLGMVGFHVVHKTVARKQWIWTTFEQVDNIPDQAQVDAQIANPNAKLIQSRYNFFDPNNLKLSANQTPPRPWDPSVEPFPNNFKSQITRVEPVTGDVLDLNPKFLALLGKSVWKYYALISTQWPSDFGCAAIDSAHDRSPDPTCSPVPTNLANSTLETFSQGTTPVASSSCMACHNNATTFQQPAKQSDFTYILEKAQ
jgi:hypothetical protein